MQTISRDKRMALLRNTEEIFFYDEKIRNTYPVIAGIDEAGRGPLAGPVVAATVILQPGLVIDRLRDSKKVPSIHPEITTVVPS